MQPFASRPSLEEYLFTMPQLWSARCWIKKMQKFLQAAGKIFLISLLTIILSFTTIEGLVRWVLPEINPQCEDARLFQMHKFGETYGYKPNMMGTSFGALVVTDNRGFRIDPTQPPTQKKKNLLVIGDSVSVAIGVGATEAYPYLLDRKLKNYHVINASVSGYNFNDYLNVLSTVIQEMNIEGIVIGICLDDFDDISQQNIVRLAKVKGNSRDSGSINQAFNTNENNGKDLSTRYPNQIVRFLRYLNDNYFNFNDFMRCYSHFYLWMKAKFADTSKDYFLAAQKTYENSEFPELVAADFKRLHYIIEGKCWIVIVILPYEYQLRTGTKDILTPQKFIIEAAKGQNLPVIDIYDPLNQYLLQDKLQAKDIYLYNDPCHFTVMGQEIVAELIYQELFSRNLVN